MLVLCVQPAATTCRLWTTWRAATTTCRCGRLAVRMRGTMLFCRRHVPRDAPQPGQQARPAVQATLQPMVVDAARCVSRVGLCRMAAEPCRVIAAAAGLQARLLPCHNLAQPAPSVAAPRRCLTSCLAAHGACSLAPHSFTPCSWALTPSPQSPPPTTACASEGRGAPPQLLSPLDARFRLLVSCCYAALQSPDGPSAASPAASPLSFIHQVGRGVWQAHQPADWRHLRLGVSEPGGQTL